MSEKTQINDILKLVNSHFNDINKSLLWLRCPNPQLGNQSPLDMIWYGREEKLIKFIRSALDDNKCNSK